MPVAVKGGNTVGDREVADAVAVATNVSVRSERVDAASTDEAVADSGDHRAEWGSRRARGQGGYREADDGECVERLCGVDATGAVRDGATEGSEGHGALVGRRRGGLGGDDSSACGVGCHRDTQSLLRNSVTTVDGASEASGSEVLDDLRAVSGVRNQDHAVTAVVHYGLDLRGEVRRGVRVALLGAQEVGASPRRLE